MSPEFLLIRHAESEWNAVGRWQGHGDPPLSADGHRQAAELAAGLLGEAVDLLVSSDLRRAVETAGYLAERFACHTRTDARLRELDVGRWTGLTREEILASDPVGLAAFESADPAVQPGGGESRSEIRARTRRAIEALVEEAPGERIAVVTHLGCIRALVPGAEPENCQVLRISATELLRAREGFSGPSGTAAPL